MCTLAANAGSDARRAAIESRWSRLPILNEAGKVVGIVSVLDLDAAPETSAAELAHPPMFLADTTPADAALRALRSHQAAIAIAPAATGQTVGIVTIKDLIRPLLG